LQEAFYAVEEGLFQGFHFQQYQQGNEGWQTAKAGGGHFFEYRPHGGDEGWQARQSPERCKMRLLPTILYRVPGAHFGPPGFTYDYLGVATQEALEAALAAGWHESLADAMAPPVAAPEVAPAPADDAPVMRAELEQKAEELGIKVDGRWSDKRLIAEIEAKMATTE
jgi:hypothetical protein